MKKAIFLLFLLFLTAVSSFSQSRRIFVDGTAPEPAQRTFFVDNFKTEASSAGHIAVNSRPEAEYILSFEVKPNVTTFEDGSTEPGRTQFVIVINFLEGGTELASFEFPFNNINEMYDYTQFLFLKAAVYIPPPVLPKGFNTFDDLVAAAEGGGGDFDQADQSAERGGGWVKLDNDWKNKWLYLRVSFDFPVTFYELVSPPAIVGEPPPNYIKPLDNRVVALPGATIGVEGQFLDFLSAEFNFQASWEHLNDKDFIGLAAGVQVKFPLKFLPNLVIAPYASVKYPVRLDPAPIDLLEADMFTEFPMLGYGGGLEISTRAGSLGAVFFDINFMYYGDTSMKNPYWGDPPGIYTEEDDKVVNYKRFVIGLAIGFKFGFISRNAAR